MIAAVILEVISHHSSFLPNSLNLIDWSLDFSSELATPVFSRKLYILEKQQTEQNVEEIAANFASELRSELARENLSISKHSVHSEQRQLQLADLIKLNVFQVNFYT